MNGMIDFIPLLFESLVPYHCRLFPVTIYLFVIICDYLWFVISLRKPFVWIHTSFIQPRVVSYSTIEPWIFCHLPHSFNSPSIDRRRRWSLLISGCRSCRRRSDQELYLLVSGNPKERGRRNGPRQRAHRRRTHGRPRGSSAKDRSQRTSSLLRFHRAKWCVALAPRFEKKGSTKIKFLLNFFDWQICHLHFANRTFRIEKLLHEGDSASQNAASHSS